jgi:hypothetical protein
MGYSSRYGKKPQEMASKSSHIHIINDPEVQYFLEQCELPKSKENVHIKDSYLHQAFFPAINPITHLIAIDGGYTEVPVDGSFPSSTLAFFQFGALLLDIAALDHLKDEPFISPDAMSKLKELDRLKLALPIKNIATKQAQSLKLSIRTHLFEFFKKQNGHIRWLDTLNWFIFREYSSPVGDYQLANCPVCDKPKIPLIKSTANDGKYKCPYCGSPIYLTDVFRLHEAIDNDFGAGGILGYLTNLFEQFIIIHTIRNILVNKPALLKSLLFIKDGPLAFFGQTANMHANMRDLVSYLIQKHDINIVGLEKSGAFVEHADEIKTLLKPGQYLLLSNYHIYKFIIPGDPFNPEPYARSSYYSGKLIYKALDERIYVLTIPTLDSKVILDPKPGDFHNLNIILMNIEKLKCDMYDNALLPIAVVNKLVSLSNHPSSVLLEKFAKQSIH